MEKSASKPNDSGPHDRAHRGWVKVVRNPSSPWVMLVRKVLPGWVMVVRNDSAGYGRRPQNRHHPRSPNSAIDMMSPVDYEGRYWNRRAAA